MVARKRFICQQIASQTFDNNFISAFLFQDPLQDAVININLNNLSPATSDIKSSITSGMETNYK